MSKLIQCFCLIFLVILAGCSNISKYDDNEVAAIVKEEEITIGDLRFLHPDDRALDYLDWAIKVELVKQEIEELNIDISEKLSEKNNDNWFGELPPENTTDEGGKQIRAFAESQAKKLNMQAEEFQREYAKKIEEQNAYIVTYLEYKLGSIELEHDKDIEEFNHKADKLLEELVIKNNAEIKVFIE